jgi:hypothetical protein
MLLSLTSPIPASASFRDSAGYCHGYVTQNAPNYLSARGIDGYLGGRVSSSLPTSGKGFVDWIGITGSGSTSGYWAQIGVYQGNVWGMVTATNIRQYFEISSPSPIGYTRNDYGNGSSNFPYYITTGSTTTINGSTFRSVYAYAGSQYCDNAPFYYSYLGAGNYYPDAEAEMVYYQPTVDPNSPPCPANKYPILSQQYFGLDNSQAINAGYKMRVFTGSSWINWSLSSLGVSTSTYVDAPFKYFGLGSDNGQFIAGMA